MEEYDVYNFIKERTGGDIYIGVVGPVRTGKSTFITNFMNKLVLPSAEGYEKDRMRDELPQSAEGRTIMTTQPKFVPAEAVTIKLAESLPVSVRLVDCVGYMVDGANGHMEDDHERMVKTPWFEDAIPFKKAAEVGTQKVICDHSTVGVLMTTDGSISTELARNSYVEAEEHAVSDLKATGKPFVIVLNSRVPDSPETKKLADEIAVKYGKRVLAVDVLNMTEKDIIALFQSMLMEFPLCDIEINAPKWIKALSPDSAVIKDLCDRAMNFASRVTVMADSVDVSDILIDSEFFEDIKLDNVDFGCGKATYTVTAKPDLFYTVLSAECNVEIKDEFELMANLTDLVSAKKQFDKLSAALKEVNETGYGVVTPTLDEMALQEPEIVRQGGRFGVKLKASAPSLHIMRVDIETEVCPIVGTEQQSEELVKYLLSEFDQNPNGIWDTNLFGKPLHNLVNEGLNSKLNAMPIDTQKKMRKTLSRIINEGKGGVICILL